LAAKSVQRRQQAGLLMVVVVALRPRRLGQRRVLLVPRCARIVWAQLALDGVGAVAERFVGRLMPLCSAAMNIR
jgi:hypothetical protein